MYAVGAPLGCHVVSVDDYALFEEAPDALADLGFGYAWVGVAQVAVILHAVHCVAVDCYVAHGECAGLED